MAAADVHIIPPDPVIVDDLDALQDIYGQTGGNKRSSDPTETAGCGSALTSAVNDGDTMLVSMPPAAPFTVGAIPATYWRQPPNTDATWRLQFQGLMWMRPIARRAAMDNQQEALKELIDQAVAFHAENPDPKTNEYGWDEGTALRRLETENCLYALSGDEALRTGMTADANVLLGSRYYGPPNHAVHNHGLMANLQLLRAGQQLDVAAWRTKAISRMVAEAPLSFSRSGVSWEQSSMYQAVNANLWADAAAALALSGQTTASDSIATTVRSAYAAYRWMTEPDGNIVQIGDADEQPGEVGAASSARTFRDSETGWNLGRWSWTDPNTVYYTVRTGPALRAHGQHDRAGGVTFSARGVRVLVGPGRFSYDRTNNYNAYQLSPQSHNVALPNGKQVTSAGGSVYSFLFQAPAHAWTVKDKMFGIDHTRSINVYRDTASMKVSDTFPKSDLWRQYWHLDPQWKLTSGAVNGTKLVFTHPTGRKLTVTTTGRVSGVALGITRPPQGWHFPSFGTRMAAPEIVIRSYGKGSVTTFQVS